LVFDCWCVQCLEQMPETGMLLTVDLSSPISGEIFRSLYPEFSHWKWTLTWRYKCSYRVFPFAPMGTESIPTFSVTLTLVAWHYIQLRVLVRVFLDITSIHSQKSVAAPLRFPAILICTPRLFPHLFPCLAR